MSRSCETLRSIFQFSAMSVTDGQCEAVSRKDMLAKQRVEDLKNALARGLA